MFRKKELDKEQLLARELFKKMSPEEKTKYIFRYYGVHIFLVVALIAGIIMYIGEWMENEKRKDWLYFVTPEYYSDAIEGAADQLLEESGWPEGLNYIPYATNDLESGFGNMQLMAYLTNDEVDYLVCDQVMCIMLEELEELKFDVVKLEETALGEQVEFRKELFVVVFKDSARYDKVMDFLPILMGEAQDGQNAQIQA